MYCAWRITAHLRCTQCSILLHLMDICYLTCICLWKISKIQACLFKVVRPGLVSTSPAFVISSASHPAGLHGRHAQTTVNRAPHCRGREGSTQVAQQLESAVTAPPLVGCVVWSNQQQVTTYTTCEYTLYILCTFQSLPALLSHRSTFQSLQSSSHHCYQSLLYTFPTNHYFRLFHSEYVYVLHPLMWYVM